MPRGLALAFQPVALFLVGEVADHPAQGVHGANQPASVFVADASERARELGTGKAQLIDERVRHSDSVLH